MDYQEVANRSGVVVSVMIQGVNISHCQLIVTSDNCHNRSPSPSLKSKVKSQKDLE